MSPRHLPQPSADAARRRLAGLLDATPDTGWEDVPDPDPAGPGPGDTAPDRATEPDGGTAAASRPRPAGWRRETVLVLAAVVLVGIVMAGLVLLRSTPLEITDGPVSPAAADVTPMVQLSPGQSPTPTTPAPSPEPTGTPSAAPATLAAHVIGEVQRPGLVVLAAGARVDDAITAAGGLTSRADPGDLNLAQPLQDGQQVMVGSSSEPGGEVRGPGAGATPAADASAPASGPGAGPSGSAAPGQASDGAAINLNTASALELEELPGVGPATAQKIITWREQNGGFATIEQLMDVPGIGPKTYAEIAPSARV